MAVQIRARPRAAWANQEIRDITGRLNDLTSKIRAREEKMDNLRGTADPTIEGDLVH